MKTTLKHVLALLVMSCCLSAGATASSDFAFDVGAGVSSHHSKADNPWLSLSAHLSFQSDRTLFIVRYVREHRFDLEISIFGGGGFSNNELTQEVALLGGIHGRIGGSTITELALGVGVVTGLDGVEYVEDGPPGVKAFFAAGVALHSAIYWRHIGLTGLGNINSTQTFGGIQFCIRFGPWSMRRASKR